MDKSKKNKKKHKNKNKKKPEEMKQATPEEKKKSPEEAGSDTKNPKDDVEGGAIKKKKRIKKKKKNVEETYKSSIFKVLKKNQPDMNISCNAMGVMNGFVNDMFEKIAELSSRRARFNHRKIITILDLETVVSVLLPHELARNAMVEGTKAVINVIQALVDE